ncbi:MAG: hypothetical protein JNK40_04845 [Chromatiales bacterium]|nr:hypothetical protein [Chromatiales bacterium]
MVPNLDTLIARLWCLHWPGTRMAGETAAALRGTGVLLDTCLRQLAFGLAPRPALTDGTGGELSSGAAAYGLLLEIASGLRSAVPGETNVFGQFRRAWDEAERHLPPDDHARLKPVVQALLADTRALRARHLQGVAGGSYGSLVRELLAPGRGARVLFVGTGELARSMLPLFRAWDVGVWNHRTLNHGSRAPLAGVCRWFESGEADSAAAWATHIVFTTPGDAAHDSAWRDRLWQHAPRGVVHLGRRREDSPAWGPLTASFDLDHVFALAGAREQQRRHQLAAAARACAALVEERLAGPRLRACSV